MTKTKTAVLPRGHVAKLLRITGFTPGVPLVDPAVGEAMDIRGNHKAWLDALESCDGCDVLDYQRAMHCGVSTNFKRAFPDAVAACFIDGRFYIEFQGAGEIERWFPTDETKELRDNFDAGIEPPKRFFMRFRAAKGSERLDYTRRNNRPRPNKPRRGTGPVREIKARVRQTRTQNYNIRNGILIAQLVGASAAPTP